MVNNDYNNNIDEDNGKSWARLGISKNKQAFESYIYNIHGETSMFLTAYMYNMYGKMPRYL